MYTIQQIAAALGNQLTLPQPHSNIEHLLTDSRRLTSPANTLFFALQTPRNNGASFIEELYHRGVRNFVVHTGFKAHLPGANLVYVNNTLKALQALAAWHRSHYNIPVIGITGSNGKTMVKEWLFQLLEAEYNIVRSPRSYNSQIGVALSVWQMNSTHSLAIFEAGISQPGEMAALQAIIQPTMGVLTNIGEAHSENFDSIVQKVQEKLLLFKDIETFIFCRDCNQPLGANYVDGDTINAPGVKVFSWGTLAPADLNILQTQTTNGHTHIKAQLAAKNRDVSITIPFTDKASIDNAITCWCVLLQLGIADAAIAAKMQRLQPIDMRMQLKKGVNNCVIINDSYNNDLSSLALALDYLAQQSSGKKTTLILSDIYQSGYSTEQLMTLVRARLRSRNIDRLVLIGPVFYANQQLLHTADGPGRQPAAAASFFASTESFLQQWTTHQFRDEVVLLKGSRVFEFERIAHWLEQKVHQTVMEVNLNAMVHNLKTYQQLLHPGTRLMAMVKAFSYGSGSAEIAAVLQFHKVDYLAVAYTDEGVELRKAGIHMPIMVMNPEEITFDLLVAHNLEPELYSTQVFEAFAAYLNSMAISQYPVHIKLDTGMHRLGFDAAQVNTLLALLANNRAMAVQSVFSHLAASEAAAHDDFTRQQAQLFEDGCQRIEQVLGYHFKRHLANSAAIVRHPQLQYDMVRLGIGLYGVQSSAYNTLPLQAVATLKTNIAQLRQVPAGETVGYGRRGVLQKDAVIATIRIGYADGFKRSLGMGNGSVYIKGALAPVVGSVCMDMTMVNVTHIEGVQQGDAVEIFGEHLPVEEVAGWAGTIPYEILTGISQRVQRVYYEE